MDFSYSRSHSRWLPQAVSKRPINRLSHKVSFASNIIDPVINGFSVNEVKSHIHIWDNKNISFSTRELCLGLSENSHVDSLDRFGKKVVDKVKYDICIF